MNISIILLVILCIICVVSPLSLVQFTNYVSIELISQWGSLLTYSALLLLIIEIGLCISPYGSIRYGTRKYSNLAYWSMICASGIGIAPIFYAVIEPVAHVNEGLSFADSMAWSFHNWMIGAGTYYCGFALATYGQKFDLQQFSPLVAKSIKVILSIATAIGLALTFLYVITLLETCVLPTILVITGLTIVSSLLHIDWGIKPISYLTIVCTLILILGTTAYFDLPFFTMWINHIWQYLTNELSMYFTHNNPQWLAQWTYNYYAQWLGWSLWLGLFIAKISQGRSLREIVVGCLIVPPVLASLYFSVLGSSAVYTGAETTQQLLLAIPYGDYLSILVSVLCITFFIVQNDGGSLILEDLTNSNRLVWIAIIAVLTYLISNFDNAVDLMRSITTIVSWPILLLLAYMFIKFLWRLRYERV